jgi:hypothetical protein
MKAYIPAIRVISVEHERTVSAGGVLRHALDARGLRNYPVRNVFCHLEAGRCGIQAGMVAVEVDGGIVWAGKALSGNMAGKFCDALRAYARRREEKSSFL